MILIQQPSMQFVDPINNIPVQRGKLYFGLPFTDPKVPANRVNVYFYNVSGVAEVLPQPVELSNSGVPTYLGQAVDIYTTQNVSIRVDDRNDIERYLIEEYNVDAAEPPNSVSVKNIKALPLTPDPSLTYSVSSLLALSSSTASASGGGVYVYQTGLNKSLHDGVRYIAPEAIAAWDGGGATLSSFYSWTGSGSGVYMLVSSNVPATIGTMAGYTNLSDVAVTRRFLTNNSAVSDLPTGWSQGRYIVDQVGARTDVYAYQIITDTNASGSSGGSVARQAIRRMRTAGVWSDWFEIINTNSALYKELQPSINNITTLRARVGAFDNQVVSVAEYNAGTDVGGGEFIWNSTSTATDNGVTVFGLAATGRWIRRWDTLTPEMAGCVGNNSTNNDAAIARLIAFARIDNTPIFWERKTYLVSTANIVDFHNCTHEGNGQISKSGTIWNITPIGTQINIINVSASGNGTNDGITTSTPTTIARAIEILKLNSAKAGDGQWRIQFAAGTMTFNGVRLDDMPLFRNHLEIFGADVALTAVPTTIWNGASSTTPYALRQDGGVAAVANWHFKNIKFINWMFGGGNNGAILVWAQGNVLAENIHCDNMGTGIWVRHGYARITHGRYENMDVYGVSAQYGASANFGNLSGGGIYIRGRVGGDCVGIAVGRNTTAYIEGCDIDHTKNHINVTRLSRIRTRRNTYGANYRACCVWNDTNSVWTPDNNSGEPDIYPTLSEEKPAYRCEMGAVHQLIDRFGQRSLHACSDGDIIQFTSTTRNALANINGTFVPFRLPLWFLYSPTFRLEVEIGISLSAGAGGVLTLNGSTDLATGELARLTIPNVAATTKGVARISVIQRSGVSTAFFSVYFDAAGIRSELNNTVNLNSASLRSNSEIDQGFRLYWQSNNTNLVELFSMRTYVES